MYSKIRVVVVVAGSTGPVLVFEMTIFDICTTYGINYLSFRTWIHVWTALILFVMVAKDYSALVKDTQTRF